MTGSATSRQAGGAPREALGALYEEHERFLWGLCYRLTGSAADADDLVQTTFVRAMESPPARTDEPWRPWLTRVAINLGRDLLRRRKRQRYVGPWLPSPIETGDESALASYEPQLAAGVTTEGRYDMLESVSFAFLLALEALTPKQRAVLLLRDVFDYSVTETADALGVSEPDVKTTHHRARRAMEAYDRERCRPTREEQDRTRAALAELMGAFARGDLASAEKQLASSVVALSDGGGEFFAARVPVVGADRVAKFYRNVATRSLAGAAHEMTMLNGLPAIVTAIPGPAHGQAAHLVTAIVLDREGRVARIWSVLATRKLTALGRTPAVA
ncbi:MAG: sigma-70 family RNA polymerase sigma factor [Candidatus Binatia bacterium]